MNGPGPEHARVAEVFEHGRLWEVCLDCGGQWSDEGGQITEGDGWCLDEALRADEERYGQREEALDPEEARQNVIDAGGF